VGRAHGHGKEGGGADGLLRACKCDAAVCLTVHCPPLADALAAAAVCLESHSSPVQSSPAPPWLLPSTAHRRIQRRRKKWCIA
jgi:hypothetical protein